MAPRVYFGPTWTSHARRVLDTAARHAEGEASLKEELRLAQEESAVRFLTAPPCVCTHTVVTPLPVPQRLAEMAKSHQQLYTAALDKERQTVESLTAQLQHAERDWAARLAAKDDDLADLEVWRGGACCPTFHPCLFVTPH